MIPPVNVVCDGDRIFHAMKDGHEFVGILICERPEQNCVHHAEYRGVRTDSQR